MAVGCPIFIIAEDGITFLVAEDGTTFIIAEHGAAGEVIRRDSHIFPTIELSSEIEDCNGQ